MYYRSEMDIDQTLTQFTELQPFIKFTTEKDFHDHIHFWASQYTETKRLHFSVDRKPMSVDIIFYHPCEYKLSGFNYLINRLHIPYLETQEYQKQRLSVISYIITYTTTYVPSPPTRHR